MSVSRQYYSHLDGCKRAVAAFSRHGSTFFASLFTFSYAPGHEIAREGVASLQTEGTTVTKHHIRSFYKKAQPKQMQHAQSADQQAAIMHIPSQHKDVFSFPTDDGDLPSAKFDLPNRRDVWYLPPGLLSHKPATLKYAGMTLQGTLCLIVSEVHQDFFARFLHIPEDEDPGKLGGSKEPWTLIHPVMGFSWVQAGRILRRVPELEADESAIFIAFTDDIHAFMCLDKLGQCK